MLATYKEHCSKVDDIREYIQVIKKITDIPLDHPDELSAQELKSFIRMPQKRSYDYSLIIITLYGIFESYVEKIMCAYLDSLRAKVQSYTDLPEALRKNHIELSTKLLGTKSAKYGEIKPGDIIANLHSCLNQTDCSYQLNVEAFRQHSTNFRKDALQEFFSQAGISGISLFITRDAQLTSFLRTSMGDAESEGELPSSKYYEMLEDLVERRNVVAHGSKVDELLSLDYLDQYAQYISLLIKAIYNCLLTNFYSILIDLNIVVSLGTPIKVFDHRIVCINSSNNAIKIGDVLISKNGDGSLAWGNIESIMIDSTAVTEVDPSAAVNIGMAVPFTAKKTFTYYLCHDDNP